ncbi:MAG: hypothetical protein HFH36_10750 [Lachnospiraceae bacterium]|nr:hypothetical protein [Lachnospiraceae bacterium]
MKFKTFLKSAIAGFTAFAMAATMMPASSLGSVKAASTDGNMILHWDMTLNEDGTLKDLSSKGHNGTSVGKVEFSKIDGIDVAELKGKDKNDPGHVIIPDGTIGNDMTEITVNMLVNITQSVKSSWMFCLGSSNTKYLYLTACSSQKGFLRGGAGNGNPGYSHESSIDGEEALTVNQWQNITVTYKDGGKFIFYKNGIKQAETDLSTGNAGEFQLKDLMTAADGLDGYMGHSFYTVDNYNDPEFQGKVADFRIYDKAMSQEEVTELYGDIDTMLKGLADNDFGPSDIDLKEEDCLGTNASKDAIETNLVLPSKTTIKGDTDPAKAATITKWTSSDPTAIKEDGTVTRSTSDKTVTLTATVERNGIKVDKTLTFKVLKTLTEEEAAQMDLDALYLNKIKDDIRGNIYLNTTGENGSQISWESSDESIISTKDDGKISAGKVNRAADKDSKVTLTATAVLNSSTATKTYECTVKKAYTTPETTDYIFAYFPYTSAGGRDERIYFGISEDGLNFSALNDKKFILESKYGTHGLRDPFIIRSHEGDRFFLIATDLTVAGLDQDGTHYPGQDWNENQVKGSQKIMVWESTDLVNWSEQRECKVAKDNAGCTWAPEAYWDDETEQYVVFWASKTGDDDYGRQRLYYATTRDFYQFSEPQVWIEEAGSVIDTTVLKVGEYYYRYTKNEDGKANKHGTPSKHVYCERSKSLTATEWEFVYKDSLAEGTDWAIEGPCIYKFNDDDRTNAKTLAALKDITLDDTKDIYGLIADRNGNYIFPGVSDDITTGKFSRLGDNKSAEVNGTSIYSMPEPIASHGTIMPITSEEYNNLRLKWDTQYKTAADTYVKQADAAEAELSLPATKVSSDMTLPSTTSNGAEITWESSNEAIIAPNGKVNRPSYKEGDAVVTLTATITAKSSDKAIRDQIRRKSFEITVEKRDQDVFTVTFNSKGGSAVKKQTVTDGQKAVKPKNPTKKGYTFAGWLNGSKAYNFNTAVTKNLTLTAKWTKVTVKTPSKPTLKNNKGKKIAVTIKKVSGAAGYQVTYSTDKKFGKKATKTADSKKNTLTLTKLKKDKTYYVKVKAYKKDSAGKKVYSKFSKVSSIKVKK